MSVWGMKTLGTITKWPLPVTNPDGSDIAEALESLATSIRDSSANTDATLTMLKKIVNMLAPLVVTDSSHRQKVTIESPPQILWYYAYPAWWFNLPVNAAPAANTSTHYVQPVQVWPVDQRELVKENARLMFAMCTRANLSFT